MTPLDLVPEAEIQSVLDKVAEEFSVHTTLQDSEGIIILEGGGYSTICSRVRRSPRLMSLVCGLSNMSIFETAIRMGRPHTDLCEIGMFKTVVPIFRDGSFIGGLSACGVALEDEQLDAFLVSKTLQIGEKRAESLIKEIKIITENQGQRIADQLDRGFRALCRDYHPSAEFHLSR